MHIYNMNELYNIHMIMLSYRSSGFKCVGPSSAPGESNVVREKNRTLSMYLFAWK